MHPLLAPDTDSELIRQARHHLSEMYSSGQNRSFILYHDQFAFEQADLIATAAKSLGLPREEKDLAQLMALFRTLGHWIDGSKALSKAEEELANFLLKVNREQLIADLSAAWRTLAQGTNPSTNWLKLVEDAWTIGHYAIDYSERSGLARIEQETNQHRNLPRNEWANLQLRELMQARLHTTWARSEYSTALSRNLLSQRNKIEKQNRNQGREELIPIPTSLEDDNSYRGLEPSIPIRGAQTYFRTTYRVHINLSAIADNKANIMISVNTIMISVLITFLSYRNIAETNPAVLLPVIIFLVTGLASLTFAVLSARPKVTQLPSVQDKSKRSRNLFFFGNFIQLPLEDYENAVDEVLHNEDLLYGNMARDLYYLGKVLDAKYRYLSNSYNIFMVGFVATVATFLITLFV